MDTLAEPLNLLTAPRSVALASRPYVVPKNAIAARMKYLRAEQNHAVTAHNAHPTRHAPSGYICALARVAT